MTTTLILVLSLFHQSDPAPSPSILWSCEPVSEALERAIKDRRPAMVYFMARWCALCQKLEEGTLRDPSVAEATRDVLCVLADCSDRASMEKARAQYGICGTPTLLFFSANGSRTDEIVGAADAEVLRRILARLRTGIDLDLPDDARSGTWRDTHRALLRNGRVIEGRLLRFHDDIVALRYDLSSEIHLRTEDVLRVERISLRHLGEQPEQIPPTAPLEASPLAARSETTAPPPSDIQTAIDTLLMQVEGTSEKDREALQAQLRKHGIEGARALIHRLPTLNEGQTRWAFSALGTLRDLKLNPDFCALLDSPFPNLRAGAIRLLADRGARSALPAMRRLLRESEASVRSAAATAIGRLGDVGDLPLLANGAIDGDEIVRQSAIQAATDLAERTASGSLLAEHWLHALPRAKEQSDILDALSRLARSTEGAAFPRARIITALLDLAIHGRSPGTRSHAVIGLGELQAIEYASSLNQQLSLEQDPDVLSRLCEALAKLHQTSSIGPLIELLRSRSQDVVNAAAWALRQITKQLTLGSDPAAWTQWFQASLGHRQ